MDVESRRCLALLLSKPEVHSHFLFSQPLLQTLMLHAFPRKGLKTRDMTSSPCGRLTLFIPHPHPSPAIAPVVPSLSVTYRFLSAREEERPFDAPPLPRSARGDDTAYSAP
ncbi:hypothetical protein C8J57DRAFT_1247620 [Mycena rebaudengoi]|nr:hypothetical protein C8J57DRAFT_1247620 [Mycena rebaudengoi]